MSSLLDVLNQQLSGDTVRQLSRQLGADEASTARAVEGAVPLLVSALARNTARPQGAQSLLGALDRDHDGSVLDDLGSFLGGGRTAPGDAILGHVLGSRRDTAENGLSRMSGLDPQTVSRLLAMLAPIVMGALGRTRREQRLDPGGLAEMLGGERRRAERAAPDAMGMLGQLLDSDGDGQVIDDLAKLGSGFLGQMLGGGRRR